MPRVSFPTTVNDLADYANDRPKRLGKKFEKKMYNIYQWIYIRSRLSEAQNHRCCWCFRLTTETRNRKDSATVEHYECKSLGGSDDLDNLVMACHDCNQKRGIKSPEEFLASLHEKICDNQVPERNKKYAPLTWFPALTMENRGYKTRVKKMHYKLYKNPELVWC